MLNFFTVFIVLTPLQDGPQRFSMKQMQTIRGTINLKSILTIKQFDPNKTFFFFLLRRFKIARLGKQIVCRRLQQMPDFNAVYKMFMKFK